MSQHKIHNTLDANPQPVFRKSLAHNDIYDLIDITHMFWDIISPTMTPGHSTDKLAYSALCRAQAEVMVGSYIKAAREALHAHSILVRFGNHPVIIAELERVMSK